MVKTKLVIFDMDGLLFDTEPIFFKAFQRAAKKLGHDFSFATYLKFIGVTDETGRQILAEIYGKDSSILHAFDFHHEEFDKILEEEGLVTKPGAEALLDVLDEKGIKKCIASSSPIAAIERNLQLSGLQDRFDFYVSGDEVKHGKPEPDIFLEAVRRSSETCENTLVLEDSNHGLQAAINANIRCIIVPDLIEPNEETQKQAYRIFTSLGEVAEWIK